MFSCNLRALATALVIGTATVGAVGMLTTTVAQAQSLRGVVGKPLLEAQSMANAGNYAGARAKIREAEGASGKTPAEERAIDQMKQFVASKSGDFASLGGVAGAKAKFAAAYNGRRYQEVINMEDELRKNNALDANSQQVIAQAYYQMRNHSGCVNYLRRNFGAGGGETVQSLLRSCATDGGDAKTAQEALERLVASTQEAKYWNPLLQTALRMRGLRDPQTLDIYRIKSRIGGLTTPIDYMTLAQLAIAVGLPKEGQDVVQKGIEAKVLTGERPARLSKMAGDRTAAANAALAQTTSAANAAATGDALVKLGEYQNSVGNSADAVKTIQAGIAKGVTDKNFAQVRLGIAQLDAKQKDQAIRSFAAVKGDPNWESIARLWTLYARR